jgi:hypothetical protein
MHRTYVLGYAHASHRVGQTPGSTSSHRVSVVSEGTLPTELDQVAGCAPERAPALAELAQPAATRLNSRGAATSATTPFRRQMGRAGGPAPPVIAIALLPTVSTPPSRFLRTPG